MANRITGMYSGLDTETLINDLVKAKRTKIDTITKDKTKLEWKQEKWNDLNKKIKSFYSKSVANLRWTTSFTKKATTVSNSSAVSVITGESAMNSVQSLSIKSLASSGYLTGAKVERSDGSTVTGETKVSDLSFNNQSFSGSGSFSVNANGKSTTITIDDNTTIDNVVWQLNRAGVSANFDEKNGRIFIGAKSSGSEADFTITADSASGSMAMSALGINASLSDEAKEQYTKTASYSSYFTGSDAAAWVESIQNAGTDSEIYKTVSAAAKAKDEATLSSKESELETLKNAEEPDDDAIAALETEIETLKTNINAGVYSTSSMEAAATEMKARVDFAATALTASSDTYNAEAKKLKGEDAVIKLNGVEFTSSSNNFEINGLTFTCNAVADDITVTTQNDTDGVYDVVKNFIKEYNELIKEISTLYNADSTSLAPLTDEEKDAISETEAKKIEDSVKDSLLRNDSTLGTIFTELKSIMGSGITVGDSTIYLSDFGIETGSYFSTTENERNVLHIDGDTDDEVSGGNADKLKTAIANDPDTVVNFFTELAKNLYSKLTDLSAASSNSSYGSFFDDKLMKNDISSYSTKISDAEDKLADEEDKLYSKFAAMETALSKMNSNSSYLSSLFSS